MNVKDFILNELNSVNPKKVSTVSIVIRCPYHQEKTPSFSINVDETNRRVPLGWGRCFGCGASKNWNETAEKLGLNKLKGMRKDGTVKQNHMVPLNEKMKRQLLGSKGLTLDELEASLRCMLSRPIETGEEWRSFKGKFLAKIGCQVTVDEYDNKCLLMPVVVDGEIVGGQKALWEKSKNKKVLSYVNMAGEWILHQGLFPYDYTMELIKVKSLHYVVLVEGARDALRLLAKGIPALAILGTNNWGKEKRNLVLALGVEKVVVMMDADAAGIKASNNIMKDLKGRTTRQLVKLKELQNYLEKKKGRPLESNIDQGNCPEKYLDKIIESF